MNELVVIGFIASLLLMLFLFFNAYENIYTKLKLLFWFLILILFQGYLTILDFYQSISEQAFRMLFVLAPAIILIISAFKSKSFKDKLFDFSPYLITYVFVIRIFIEIILHQLSRDGLIPIVMTFEGRNFDIFIGLSAPLIAYFGFKKRTLPNVILIAWNIIAMLILANVAIHGILSAPTPFQHFVIDKNNFALLRLPLFCFHQ